MSKLIPFFILAYLFVAVWGGIAQAGGGVVSRSLTAGVAAGDLSLPIGDTSNFLNDDVVIIGEEEIHYTAKTATNLTIPAGGRGYNDTEAVAHSLGDMVYTRQMSVVNRMANYNIGVVAESDGWWAFAKIPLALLTLMLHVFVVDFASFLGEEFQLLNVVWTALGIGLIAVLAIYLFAGRRPV